VLDLLNSSFEDFAYIRYEVKRYLDAQPPELRSPAELMVTGNQSLEMVEGYTRSREDLLETLEHIPPILPYKHMSGSFWAERFVQSIDALQQIALQNRGVPGRKNIIWVGHGGPSVNTAGSPWVDELDQYVRATTNLLVDARMSLFVIYPGLEVSGGLSLSAMDAQVVLNDTDPFAGDISFGVFANETGGKLFYNRNDVDEEMRESVRIGSEYYTLTYQPQNSNDDGRFERIRVTLRDPNLRAVTKAGYFAPDKKAKIDPRQQTLLNMTEATQSTVPYDAVELKIAGIVRHPDSRAVELTVELPQKGLGWLATDNGWSNADLMLSVASLNGNRDILASRVEGFTVSDNTTDQTRIAAAKAVQLTMTVRMPRKTQSVRVVVEADASGRIGAAEVGRKVIDAAPAEPTPQPQLAPRRPDAAPASQ
jgi:VWFA-related protein